MNKHVRRAAVSAAATAAVLTAAVPGAEAATLIPCNGGSTQVCFTEIGPTNVSYSIPNTGPGTTINVADVDAYLDIYSIPFGTGSVQIPCITAIVNGAEQDTCGQLGLTRFSRTSLVKQGAGVPVPSVGNTYLATVYVCEAELTATVLDVGIKNFPTLTVCTEMDPVGGTE